MIFCYFDTLLLIELQNELQELFLSFCDRAEGDLQKVQFFTFTAKV